MSNGPADRLVAKTASGLEHGFVHNGANVLASVLRQRGTMYSTAEPFTIVLQGSPAGCVDCGPW